MAYRNKETERELGNKQNQPDQSLPVLTVDYEKYSRFLEESDASVEDKQKLIETLWNITMMFVDMGIGVHPVQQAQKACGQSREKPRKSLLVAPDKVKYPRGKLV